MSKQISKKHHFIPQFYIKGFSDQNSDVFLFNKEYKTIGKSPKKPSQIFYEHDLYTLNQSGETSLLIEDSYGQLENMFAKVVLKLEECSNESLSELLNMKEFSNFLIMMMSVQYWRNPNQTIKANILAADLVNIYEQSLEKNREVIPFTRKDIKFYKKKCKNKAMQKFIQFFVLPVITFKFHPEQLKGFSFLVSEPGNDFLCSDNPVIIDSIDAEFNFEGGAFFPISKTYALSNKKFQGMGEVDELLLLNAKKKVIGSSKERLQSLLKLL
ncbi:DUF4238 domain-containing protein [Pseudoalteromonas sp. SR41-8]|uniref:DUF4238 domain-containing protein n=1 Tax=Pseudoalteromonas sp. SR41-8 TaxID=2760946 RepID=UPI0015FEEE83|nr:DUF4238 domain-containing protein [Pseudoalteromonas sp. SR41-8]MBB1308574.1 DUF4238 domain-containing protein [Pseudoalteromonas sp. SR41-8]